MWCGGCPHLLDVAGEAVEHVRPDTAGHTCLEDGHDQRVLHATEAAGREGGVEAVSSVARAREIQGRATGG